MQFQELIQIIKRESINNNFQQASDNIQNIIFKLNKIEIIPIISEVGAIPEFINHDSTEEKLYTKVSDIILAKCNYIFQKNFYNFTNCIIFRDFQQKLS